MATRHLLRSVILQSLYEWDFYERKIDLTHILDRNMNEFALGVDEPEFAWKILKGIVDHLEEIDGMIVQLAPEWPLDKIAPIDRNILRIGLWELLHQDQAEVPAKVAINESIELAKGFGGPNSPKFINGVLGTVYRERFAKHDTPRTAGVQVVPASMTDQVFEDEGSEEYRTA